MPGSAVVRLERLVNEYPGYSHLDKALYYLGLAYSRGRAPDDAGKAAATFAGCARSSPRARTSAEIPKES